MTVTATTSHLLFISGSLTTLKYSSHCSHYVDERMLSPNKRMTFFFFPQGMKLALSKETLDLVLCDEKEKMWAGACVCPCMQVCMCVRVFVWICS